MLVFFLFHGVFCWLLPPSPPDVKSLFFWSTCWLFFRPVRPLRMCFSVFVPPCDSRHSWFNFLLPTLRLPHTPPFCRTLPHPLFFFFSLSLSSTSDQFVTDLSIRPRYFLTRSSIFFWTSITRVYSFFPDESPLREARPQLPPRHVTPNSFPTPPPPCF